VLAGVFGCAIGSIREETRKVAALTIFHVILGAGGTCLHIWLSLELIFLPARINGVAREMDWWGKGGRLENGQCLLSLRHFRFVLMIYTYVMGLLRSFQKLPVVMTLLGRLP
jgi:hypothetical protein